MMSLRRVTAGLALAGTALALPAAAPAAATYTYRSTGSSAAVSCHDFDPVTNTETRLESYAGQDASPDPEGNGSSYGYVFYYEYNHTTGEFCYGYGQVLDTPSFVQGFTSASYGAMITLVWATLDPITGLYAFQVRKVPVTVDLAGTGAISGSGPGSGFSTQIPPLGLSLPYGSTYSALGATRAATDSITLDGRPLELSSCGAHLLYGQATSTTVVEISLLP